MLMIGRLYPSSVKRINSRKHVHLDPNWNAPTAKLVIFIILVAFSFDLSLKYTIDVLTPLLVSDPKNVLSNHPPKLPFLEKVLSCSGVYLSLLKNDSRLPTIAWLNHLRVCIKCIFFVSRLKANIIHISIFTPDGVTLEAWRIKSHLDFLTA